MHQLMSHLSDFIKRLGHSPLYQDACDDNYIGKSKGKEASLFLYDAQVHRWILDIHMTETTIEIVKPTDDGSHRDLFQLSDPTFVGTVKELIIEYCRDHETKLTDKAIYQGYQGLN